MLSQFDQFNDVKSKILRRLSEDLSSDNINYLNYVTKLQKTITRLVILKQKELIAMKKAIVDRSLCVACGCCVNVCPKSAISVYKGLYAAVNNDLCVGCRKCAKECPASVIFVEVVQ